MIEAPASMLACTILTIFYHMHHRTMQLLGMWSGFSYNKIVSIGNHTHSSPIIVLAIVKIGQGEAESDFYNCMYNYFSNWTRMCVIAYSCSSSGFMHMVMSAIATSGAITL